MFAPPSKPTQTCLFISSVAQTHKQPNTPGLEQQDGRGLEAIVSDLELTDDPEEATEAHASASELDRVVEGDDPVEVRQIHHVSAHSPFPEMAATSCGCTVID